MGNCFTAEETQKKTSVNSKRVTRVPVLRPAKQNKLYIKHIQANYSSDDPNTNYARSVEPT